MKIAQEYGWRFRLASTLSCLLAFGSATTFLFAQTRLLRAGAAREDITPPPSPTSLAPTGKYEHETLYARAIVIDNGDSRAALIGIDQSNISDAMWVAASTRIAQVLHCPIAHILISATHTHSPGVAGRPPDGAITPVQQKVVDEIVHAVNDAVAKLEPARMAFGTGAAYLNVNRDAIDPGTHLWTQGPNTIAASDKTVAVVKFEDLHGKPIGVYVNYAMHPVSGYLSDFTSADFAGAMSRWVEQAYDDRSVVIFTQGASGDQNPLYLRTATNGLASRSGVPITGDVLVRESVEGPLRDGKVQSHPMDAKTRDRLESFMQSEGELLGEEVIRVMTNSTHSVQSVRITGTQTDVTCPGRKRLDQGREGMTATYQDGAPIPIRLGLLGIGDVALTTVDAEVYTLISQRLKRQSPMTNTVMVTLTNGAAPSGYIPDDASFSHNSFQVLNSRLKPGCAEDLITNTLADMISHYLTPQ